MFSSATLSAGLRRCPEHAQGTMLPISKETVRLGEQVAAEFIGDGTFRGEVVHVGSDSFDVHFSCDGTK